MLNRLKEWWTLDEVAEENSADNPLSALNDNQRRNSGPLLALAFGWGFLVTGLFTGTQLGNGIPFWPDIIYTTFLGNLANFIVGAVVGYIGYKTACNSGLLYRYVYGNIGAYIPVLFIAILTIGWQGIVVGAFGITWTLALNPRIKSKCPSDSECSNNNSLPSDCEYCYEKNRNVCTYISINISIQQSTIACCLISNIPNNSANNKIR